MNITDLPKINHLQDMREQYRNLRSGPPLMKFDEELAGLLKPVIVEYCGRKISEIEHELRTLGVVLEGDEPEWLQIHNREGYVPLRGGVTRVRLADGTLFKIHPMSIFSEGTVDAIGNDIPAGLRIAFVSRR